MFKKSKVINIPMSNYCKFCEMTQEDCFLLKTKWFKFTCIIAAVWCHLVASVWLDLYTHREDSDSCGGWDF